MKKTVNLAWPVQNIPFDPLRELTLKSWLSHGFSVNVWSYDNFTYPDTNSRDAREILPEDSLFEYEGSMAHWKDMFSFKLIGEQGGWFSDLDVYWVNPPPEVDDYWFAGMDIFYGPSSPSPIWLEVYEKLKSDYYGPSKQPNAWGATRYSVDAIMKSHGIKKQPITEDWKEVRKASTESYNPADDLLALHFCNFNNGGLLKERSTPESYLGRILKKHGLKLTNKHWE